MDTALTLEEQAAMARLDRAREHAAREMERYWAEWSFRRDYQQRYTPLGERGSSVRRVA